MSSAVRDTAPIRLSADVGGTFTDVAAFNETTGELKLGKALTTAERLVTGIETGVEKAGSRFQESRLFLHGTTVAINTILERSGARCALLTTQGFRDIYEIGPSPCSAAAARKRRPFAQGVAGGSVCCRPVT